MVDINYHHPDGRTQRVRAISPVQTKRDAQAYERELLRALAAGTYGKARREPPSTVTSTTEHNHEPDHSVPDSPTSDDPTIAGFVDAFIEGHSKVERLRESTIDSQRGLLRNHIVPTVGSVRVSDVGTKHFGQLKRAMSSKGLSGKTINNALAVLSRLTRFWYEREGRTAPRFKAGLIKLDEGEAEFYEPAEYEALVAAAAKLDPTTHAVVLLMGDAGLRQGEVCALRWEDIRREPEPVLRIKRSQYKKRDQPGTKGRRARTVPLTPRLAAALEALPRRRRQVQVLVRGDEDQPLTPKAIRHRLLKAEELAGVADVRGLSHKLRHTFATRLVASNVPLWVIKELLGHQDLRTTQRYLHMLSGAAADAISALARHAHSRPSTHGTAHGTMMAPPEPPN